MSERREKEKSKGQEREREKGERASKRGETERWPPGRWLRLISHSSGRLTFTTTLSPSWTRPEIPCSDIIKTYQQWRNFVCTIVCVRVLQQLRGDAVCVFYCHFYCNIYRSINFHWYRAITASVHGTSAKTLVSNHIISYIISYTSLTFTHTLSHTHTRSYIYIVYTYIDRYRNIDSILCIYIIHLIKYIRSMRDYVSHIALFILLYFLSYLIDSFFHPYSTSPHFFDISNTLVRFRSRGKEGKQQTKGTGGWGREG